MTNLMTHTDQNMASIYLALPGDGTSVGGNSRIQMLRKRAGLPWYCSSNGSLDGMGRVLRRRVPGSRCP